MNSVVFFPLRVTSSLLVVALDDNQSVPSQDLWLVVRAETNSTDETFYSVTARVESSAAATSLANQLNGA